MKVSRLIFVISSGLSLAGPAHAQGGRSENVNPLQVFWTQLTTPIGAATGAAAEPDRDRQIVRASWYGGGERLSQHTSTGEIFRPMGHTAAHRTLPFGTMVRVTNLRNGRTVVVRINDRGPFDKGRVIDITPAAAKELDFRSCAGYSHRR